ncbi:bifunctional heptose 7-phosphate kinase/heptose 1-phosphate adenyltransferase [Mucilaginibacter sp. OK283]|uniref:bifunctional heptose 7-phosphate kinase/heptose 1-phosphate adenyltransferase n=1 Tax=Mucilaginibacter sp. OK283 TaxID=1881049 RepID=UPI0008AFD759|nr:bifunctional ADP-heptose synthase [Mucilaginibacter sp. OK283]SEP40133.1 D-beta-D-heptose 7-phosphate kinase / D-beta-D-heptose 1-phosphate adenosyltransferase [Mucilaginibacter sp. OK283]
MNLSYLLKGLSTIKVLVIGDLMLDHYIWGNVHRISPEAPVPVVQVNKDTYTAGGAANVAINLSNLGVKTKIMGHCTMDEAGKKLLGILSGKGVKYLPPELLFQAPTIVKTRVIVHSQQLCRIDREDTRECYTIDSAPGFENMLRQALSDVDAVIVSDYAKGVISQSLLDSILKIARDLPDLLVALDPKPARRLSFRGVGLLTPNRAEALALAELPEPAPEEKYPIEKICRRIHDIYNPEILIVTLGADGMAISHRGEVVEHLPTVARQVFDVSGAGDTVIATLTAALASGANAAEAARFANAAAGCVVAHVGTAPIDYQELEDWLLKADMEYQSIL